MSRFILVLAVLGSVQFCCAGPEDPEPFVNLPISNGTGLGNGRSPNSAFSNGGNAKIDPDGSPVQETGDKNLITEPSSTKHATESVGLTNNVSDANKTTNPEEGPLSTIVGPVIGACAVTVVIGMVVILFLRRRSRKRDTNLRVLSSFNGGGDSGNPYDNMDPKPNKPRIANDRYTNLTEQESSSISTIGSINNISHCNISMLPSPDGAPPFSSAVSMPVSYIPKSRRAMNNEVDKRMSCPDWKVLDNQGVSRASSQDSGFVSSTSIQAGSHMTLGSSMSGSIYSDLSVNSLDKSASLKDVKPAITKTDMLKTRSLKPGMYGTGCGTPPSPTKSLHLPLKVPDFMKQPHEYPESNLQALIEPFLKNPTKFRNKDGRRRTYATMSFAIGSFDSTGGVLSLPNRSVELIIPPHAVEKETVIYFSVVSHNQNKPKEISFTPEIDLGPDGTRFNCPVMLTFQHCSNVNENSNLSYAAMVQEGDHPWREMSYDESMCTLMGDRACLFMDHFSRVKIVIKEGIEPDAASIEENVELEDDKVDDAASVSTIVPSSNNSSAEDSISTVCSHNGACACPERVSHQREWGARPKTREYSRAMSSSSSLDSSLNSTDDKKPKKGALVRVKRVIQDKLRPIAAFRGKANGVVLNLTLCCFVEKCEQMVKIRVYYATTAGIIDDIVLKEHGDQATAPCSFIYRQGHGSMKFKLDTSYLEMYWPAQTAFEGLSEEHVTATQYDHVEFTVKPTSATNGLVKVFQSKRPNEKRKLYPTWGKLETMALQAKHRLQCVDAENMDIIQHMLATRGVEPVEMVPQKPAIPYRLLMELCKLLDPDERACACLADDIGIDYNESKWIQSRKSSYTKAILTFLQGLFYKDNSDQLLRKLFVHLKNISHHQAAEVVLEYLSGTSRLRGRSSSSQSSSENDVNNSSSGGRNGSNPPRTQRSDSNQSTTSTTSLSSINTSSSTIASFSVNGHSKNRALSDTDSGYSPSPSSPPVVTSSITPGVHMPTYRMEPVMTYKIVNSHQHRGQTLATPL